MGIRWPWQWHHQQRDLAQTKTLFWRLLRHKICSSHFKQCQLSIQSPHLTNGFEECKDMFVIIKLSWLHTPHSLKRLEMLLRASVSCSRGQGGDIPLTDPWNTAVVFKCSKASFLAYPICVQRLQTPSKLLQLNTAEEEGNR